MIFILTTMLVLTCFSNCLADGTKLLNALRETIEAQDTKDFTKIKNSIDSGHAVGLIRGMRAMNEFYQIHFDVAKSIENPLFCCPESVTNLETMRIVASYLEKNPDYLELEDAFLVGLALREAFPCSPRAENTD